MKICTTCGSTGNPTRKTKGSFLLEVVERVLAGIKAGSMTQTAIAAAARAAIAKARGSK